MAAKFLVLLACVALSGAASVVKRETAAAASPSWVLDLQGHAEEFGRLFKQGLDNATNSADAQAVHQSFKDGAQQLGEQVNSFAQTLQNALTDATGKTKETLEQVQASLAKSATELRAAHPEVEQQAAQLKEQLLAAVNNVTQGSQKLAKEFNSQAEEANKKIAPRVKAAYDDFVKQTQEIQKKISEAANKQ